MIPSPADLVAARARLAGHVIATPLEEMPPGCLPPGAPRLLLKLENRQHARCFKPRGALNAALRRAEAGSLSGLITFSSGNHGQAVALAARTLGIPCLIVAPEDVRPGKRQAMEALGATVRLHGLTSAERMDRATALAAETAYALIPPYDDFDVICGQSTVGQEIAEQAPGCDAVIVPVGGGGLISGIALATSDGCRVEGVEPGDADDARRSLAAGRLERNAAPSTSACDGLRNTCLGDLPWRIIRDRVRRIVAVSEAEIAAAVTALDAAGFGPVEPSGAAATAAVLAGHAGREGETVVAIVSGGNAS